MEQPFPSQNPSEPPNLPKSPPLLQEAPLNEVLSLSKEILQPSSPTNNPSISTPHEQPSLNALQIQVLPENSSLLSEINPPHQTSQSHSSHAPSVELNPSPNYQMSLSPDDFTQESQQFLNDYHCPLCSGIYHNALVDICGHVFCKECFDTFTIFTKSNQLTCPITSNPLSAYPSPIPLVSNVLNKLQIQCKNRKSGCEWIGLLMHLKGHLSITCPKQIVSCELKGCEAKCFRENIKSHMDSCVYRVVQCSYCEVYLAFIELSSHHDNVCPKIEIDCPQQCGKKEKREAMNEHLKLYCGNTVVKCPLDRVGCQTTMFRKELDDYLETNSTRHMIMIVDQVESNEAKRQENTKVIEELVKENSTLKMQIEECKKHITEMQKTINTLNANINSIHNVFLNKKRNDTSIEQMEIAPSQRKENNTNPTVKKHPPSLKTQNQPVPFKGTFFDELMSPKTIQINANKAKLVSNEFSQQLFLFSSTDINCYDKSYDINSYVKWTINLLTCSSWLGIGICDKTQVVMNGLKFNPIKKDNYNNGVFLLSSNGYIWNSNNSTQNNIQINETLNEGDSVTFKYIPFKKQLQFQIKPASLSPREQVTESLDDVFPSKGDTLTPCIIFLHPLDEIEISSVIFGN